MKKHEAKKEQYIKLIEFFEKIFSETNFNDKKINEISPEMKREFFNLGSSLLFYGSKKLYRQYIFYRELHNNPLINYSKYYDDKISLYILSDIFMTIRKEIGLNKFDNITSVEALAFFVNDFAHNPLSKIDSFKARYKIRMLKLEMYFFDRINFVYLKKLFYVGIIPVFSSIKIATKFILLLPIGKLILKINPNANEDLINLEKKLQNYSKKINS